MTTVVNNPTPVAETGNNNLLIGVIIFMGFVAIFLYFGIPAIKQMGPIRVNIPAPQIAIPEKVNVNVNQGK